MSNITIQLSTNRGCNTCGKSLIILPDVGGCGCMHPVIPSNNTPNSPCVDCDSVCDDSSFSDCNFYSGADIPSLGIKNGDKLTKIIITLAAEVIDLKRRVAILEA